jgi:hypothetical protein
MPCGTVAETALVVRIAPSTGPMHGVQPNAKAKPMTQAATRPRARDGGARRLFRHLAVRRLRSLQAIRRSRVRGIGAVILAFCWAHGRRRFYEIAKAGSAPIAEEALRRIAALYAIEAQIRGRSAEESRAARQAESNPWSGISRGGWKLSSRAPPTNRPLPWRSAAVRNHREGLKRFLEDGRIEIVTNIVERSMQPIALSRKNTLFAGHDNGGGRLGVFLSLSTDRSQAVAPLPTPLPYTAPCLSG